MTWQALGVPEYVSRHEEESVLAQVEQVRTDGRSRAVLLYGGGGVGKTRMVRALARRDGSDGQVRWILPIDVDDSEFWLLENLQRVVAEQLDPDGAFFEPFRTYLSRLPSYTREYTSKRIGRETVSSHYRRMRELFVSCYTEFVAATGTTVVLTLDTVETIRGMYLLVSLNQWLTELPNTLFVFSGRPTQRWDEPDPIRLQLEDQDHPVEVVEVKLGGFDPAEARRFLDESVLGEALTDEFKQRLVDLTEGQPLWLALSIDYLRHTNPPAEMTEPATDVDALREAYRHRLITRYRSTDFWAEAIKRLAVVRHSVDVRIWRELMSDRELPEDVADWDEAWQRLRHRPWIRVRANARYVTLHDALAEELALRLIPAHDRNEEWRTMLWRKAFDVYERLTAPEYPGVLHALSTVFETVDDEQRLVAEVAKLDTHKRELDQLRTSALHYLLLSDAEAGAARFAEQFAEASTRHDQHFQELICHELTRFLPQPGPGHPAAEDAVGVVIDRFRAWLAATPERYLQIGLNIADFLIHNSQPRPAVELLDRLPVEEADADLRYRLANERGNAWMRIPGQVGKAREFFQFALTSTAAFASPLRERHRAEAFKELGYYTRNLGRWGEADGYYEQAHDVIAGIVGPGGDDEDREEMASIQTNWAYLKALQGHYDEAKSLVESATAVRQRLGREHGIAISLGVSGEVYRYDRKFGLAWNHYQQAEALFLALRNYQWLGLIYQEQAICLVQAHDEGFPLVEDDPIEQAKASITQALDICRDQVIRWYPSALNRAGRIFGRDDPDTGLVHLSASIAEARKVADGWFFSAGLIEYLELCYRTWLATDDTRYRDLIQERVGEVTRAIEDYDFTDLKGRWSLLRGHLALHDALTSGETSDLGEVIDRYSDGFLILAGRTVGSYGTQAIASEFDRFHRLFVRLPSDVQHEWYHVLRERWSSPASSAPRSTSLLARLEQLY